MTKKRCGYKKNSPGAHQRHHVFDLVNVPLVPSSCSFWQRSSKSKQPSSSLSELLTYFRGGMNNAQHVTSLWLDLDFHRGGCLLSVTLWSSVSACVHLCCEMKGVQHKRRPKNRNGCHNMESGSFLLPLVFGIWRFQIWVTVDQRRSLREGLTWSKLTKRWIEL